MKRLLSIRLSQNAYQAIIVIFLVIFAFLMLFTFRSAVQSYDGLAYALSAKTGHGMFHPHHLIYTPMVHLFLLAISSIWGSCDAIFAGQIYNILWAIVTILSFYFIIRRLFASSFMRALAAVFLFVTQGFWVLSTQVEVYVPAAGCLALLTAAMIVSPNTNFTKGKMVMILLLLAVSILSHQVNILFCIPLGYYLIATQGRRSWKELVTILLLAGIIVLSVYVLAYLSRYGKWTFGKFLRFCFAYTFHPNPAWGRFEYFSGEGISKLLGSQLWNFVWFPHQLRNATISIFAASIAILFMWNLMQIVKHAAHEKIRGFLLIWIIPYFIFFLWWLPGSNNYFFLTLFPILLLAFLTLKDIMDRLKGSNSSKWLAISVIAILIVVIFTINFTKTVLPLHRSRGPFYRQASKLADLAPEECTIVTHGLVKKHLLYYFDFDARRVLSVQAAQVHLYQHMPLPKSYRLEKVRCIIVPISFLNPKCSIVRFSGYKNPMEWLEFIGRLFNFEYDSKHKLSRCREFKVLADVDGTSYLLLSSSKMEVDGLEGLFRRLDNKINGHSEKKRDIFRSWLLSTAYEQHL